MHISRTAAVFGLLLLIALSVATLTPRAASTGGPVPVLVTGTATVQDTDNPARQPFSKRFDLSFSNGSASNSFTVPTGKRLVITYISSDAGVAPGGHVLLDLATINQNAQVESHLPMIAQGVILGQDLFCSSDQMTVYADAGSTVTISALTSAASGGMIVGVYGYLISP